MHAAKAQSRDQISVCVWSVNPQYFKYSVLVQYSIDKINRERKIGFKYKYKYTVALSLVMQWTFWAIAYEWSWSYSIYYLKVLSIVVAVVEVWIVIVVLQYHLVFFLNLIYCASTFCLFFVFVFVRHLLFPVIFSSSSSSSFLVLH